MTPEPDALDFVNLPKDITDDFVDSVTVNGAEYPLNEFNQAERHLWLKVRDESDLTSVLKEFGEMRRELEQFTGGTLVEKKEARIKRLDAEIDKFIEDTAFDEWGKEHEKKLNAMIAALDAAKQELVSIQAPLEADALAGTAVMQKKIEELREKQQLIHLRFVWMLAKMRHKEKRTWEEYLADAKGSDRQNAAEVVEYGNFTWETQGQSRATNRATRRALRKN
jgi:hypothetical protein